MRDAALLLWRARLRRARTRVIVITLLLALSGGLALACAAGARRTAAAYDEVLELINAADLGSSYVPLDPDESRRLIDDLQGIGEFSQLVGFQTFVPERPIAGLTSYAIYDDVNRVERPLVLEGRTTRAANEVVLNEASADVAGLGVGDRVEILVVDSTFTNFVPATMDVVGIAITDVYPDATAAFPLFIYDKSFVDSRRDSIIWGGAGMKLADGAERDAAVAELRERGIILDNQREDDRVRSQAAVRPLTVTLWVLALLIAAATIVVVGQALHRLVTRRPADVRSLAATGCSKAIVRTADLGVVVAVAVVGALGAVGVATLASPLFPQGRARRITALRGFDVDQLVLVLGALALVIAMVIAVGFAVWRGGDRRRAHPFAAPALLLSGSDPARSTGVRFATGQRSMMATVGGVAAGLTAVITAVVFTGSMARLVSRPDLAGFSWDLLGRDGYETVDTGAVAAEIGDDPDVIRVSGLSFADVEINGVATPASVWEALRGSRWPPLIDGRAPERPNEILVSTSTLERADAALGDQVTITFARDTATARVDVEMTVVGTAVSPVVGLGGADTPRLDAGVLLRREDLPSIPDTGGGNDVLADTSGTTTSEFGGAVLFDLAESVDAQEVIARFPDGLPDAFDAPTEWFESAEPAEVTQTRDAIDVVILVVVALLIGVIATIGHNLLGFVRERRDSFAVLKALGFTPGQLRATVLWQSALVVGLGVIVAVPLGIAAGRWLYRAFAADIGVIVQPVVPPLGVALVAFGATLLVQAVALVPAHRARRTAPATHLRAE